MIKNLLLFVNLVVLVLLLYFSATKIKISTAEKDSVTISNEFPLDEESTANDQVSGLKNLKSTKSEFLGKSAKFVHPNANRKPSVKVNLREYDDENVQPFDTDLTSPDRDWLDNYGKLAIITGEIQEWRNPLTGSIGRMIPKDEFKIYEDEVVTVCRDVDMHYIKMSGEELYSVGLACKKPGEEWSCDFDFKTVRKP